MTKQQDSESVDEPVTVSVARKVKAGNEAAYEAWIRGVTQAASEFPGHLGVNVLRPAQTGSGEYVTIYRFDSWANANAWDASSIRQDWIEKSHALVEGEARRKKVTGLEFWFDLPSVAAHKSPSPYKMALVATVVVYCMVMLLSTLLSPLIGPWPFWAKLLVVIPTQVLLMTFVIMPRITRWLKAWLFS